MNRFGAFAVHLGISLVIFAVLGYLIVFHWYPDFFFTSDGGWQGIRIVALVDLVLGPTLTLIVYKKGKPSLKFDLTAIGVFQAICLAAGVWVVYSERPLALVYADGSFFSMSADDYLDAGQPLPDWSRFPDSPPHWVTLKLPLNPAAQSELRRRALESETPLRTFADYYEPFSPADVNLEDIAGYSADVLRQTEGMEDTLEAFESATGTPADEWRFFRFNTRYGFSLMAMHKADRTLRYMRLPQAREDNDR